MSRWNGMSIRRESGDRRRERGGRSRSGRSEEIPPNGRRNTYSGQKKEEVEFIENVAEIIDSVEGTAHTEDRTVAHFLKDKLIRIVVIVRTYNQSPLAGFREDKIKKDCGEDTDCCYELEDRSQTNKPSPATETWRGHEYDLEQCQELETN